MNRILLIEDEGELLEIYQIMLNEAGFKTLKSDNGSDALKKLSNERFSLIISDLNLPRVAGVNVITEVRKTKEKLNYETPVLVVSAFIDQGVVKKLHSLGQIHFLVKPTESKNLISKVKSLIKAKAS